MPQTLYDSLFNARTLFQDERKSLDYLIRLFRSVHTNLGTTLEDIEKLEDRHYQSQLYEILTTLSPLEIYQLSCGLLRLSSASLTLQRLVFQEAPGFEPLDILLYDTNTRINVALDSQLEKFKNASENEENGNGMSRIRVIPSFLDALFPRYLSLFPVIIS